MRISESFKSYYVYSKVMGQKCSCFDKLKPKKKLQRTPSVEVPLQSMVYVKSNNPVSSVRLRNDVGNLMGDREYVYLQSEPLISNKKLNEIRDKEPNFEVKDRMLILGPSKEGISVVTKDWPLTAPTSMGFENSEMLSGGFEANSYCHDLPYIPSQQKLAFLDNDAKNNESGSLLPFSPRSSEISPKPFEMNETLPPIPLSINPKGSEVFPKPFEMNETVPPIRLSINPKSNEVFPKPFEMNETVPPVPVSINPRSGEVFPKALEMNETVPPIPLSMNPRSSEVFPKALEMDESFPLIPISINLGNHEALPKPFKIDEALPPALPDVNPLRNEFFSNPFKMDDVPRLD